MVKEQIVIIFNENKKRYGYRRITKELHNNDICVNHKTVRKLMKQLGLVCQVRAKRKYSSYKGEVGEVAPNLLERHFKTNQPNRKWVTDVTEFKVNDQKLYLSPILDLFNGEVVSYNLSRHPNFKQITDMLEGAFQKLPDKIDNLILHSDQGWQYQMKSYQNLLKAKGITQSMSRKATCLDNAVAENFFGLLKKELRKVCLGKPLVWTMLLPRTSSDCSRRNCSIWKNLIPLTSSKRLLSITSTITTTAELN